MLSLAFSMRAARGAYALLLGSGVSRSAGVLTGWEIVLDLVRKVAAAEGQGDPSDPAAWYREHYDEEPDYAGLIKRLAPAPGDRQGLLRNYFEPTEEEREAGRKVPTPAHHAIAELVTRGYVRVVLTTNFDRLLESALEARGLAPAVIATPDQAVGAMPLAHSRITIIKLHGDYLDIRIKNTAEELKEYDARTNRLLDQVLDEYGLVVCGWSGVWDGALRDAIDRCPSRRFTFFFASRGDPSEEGVGLVRRRAGVLLPIDSADAFFQELQEKLVALEEVDRAHPASTAASVASAKRYLAEERHHIRLHDLVMQAAQTARTRFTGTDFEAGLNQEVSKEAFRQRVKRYEAGMETVEALFAVGCFWASPWNYAVWEKALTHLASAPASGGVSVYLDLRRYPALRLFYVGGMAALAAGNYGLLARLCQLQVFNSSSNVRESAALAFVPERVMTKETAQWLHGETLLVPVSVHLFATLRAAVQELLPDDAAYAEAFDHFEYMYGLVTASLQSGRWGPVGRFRYKWGRGDQPRMDEIREEAQREGQAWPPLQAGLFAGNLETFLEVEAAYRDLVQRVQREW